MRPIFLIGYMGCGKSTLGRAVSRLTGLGFIDLDNYIENRYHQSVNDMFASEGESRFRTVERMMLHEVADFENVIVACGGGTPCFFDNMEYMRAHGTTVWLDTNEDRLFARLKRGRSKRPLIAGKSDEELMEFITDALAGRRPVYAGADLVFGSEALESRSEIDATARSFAGIMSLPLKTPLDDAR